MKKLSECMNEGNVAMCPKCGTLYEDDIVPKESRLKSPCCPSYALQRGVDLPESRDVIMKLLLHEYVELKIKMFLDPAHNQSNRDARCFELENELLKLIEQEEE